MPTAKRKTPVGPYVAMQNITPEVAAVMLSKGGKNRKPDHTIVRKYAEEMTAERWMVVPDCIAFNEKGECVNGQHRLMAIVESGVAIDLAVMHNLSTQAMPIIDRGRPRMPAHSLDIAGFEHAPVLAPIAGLIMRTESGNEGYALSRSGQIQVEAMIERIMGDHRLFATAEFMSKPEIRRGLRGICRIPHAGLVHYMGGLTSPEKVEEFVERLADGQGLEDGSPMLALREQVRQHSAAGRKLKSEQALALIIKAWLAFEDDRPVHKLQWRKSHDRFPKFKASL